MNNFEILGRHYFDEVLQPSIDSESWLAYLVLRRLYKSTSYWSYDGYHVDALVDYNKDVLWEDNWIKSTDRTVLYKEVNYLCEASTNEIVKEWKTALTEVGALD